MTLKHHLTNLFLLQTSLSARFANFARQRSYGYASSQELTNRTRQSGFRKRKDSSDDA